MNNRLPNGGFTLDLEDRHYLNNELIEALKQDIPNTNFSTDVYLYMGKVRIVFTLNEDSSYLDDPKKTMETVAEHYCKALEYEGYGHCTVDSVF